jgi:TPR repeat protein
MLCSGICRCVLMTILAMFALTMKAAHKGHGESMALYGQILMHPHTHNPVDYDQAIFWLKQAVAQNISHAQTSLALLYLGGLGVEADVANGMKVRNSSTRRTTKISFPTLCHSSMSIASSSWLASWGSARSSVVGKHAHEGSSCWPRLQKSV